MFFEILGAYSFVIGKVCVNKISPQYRQMETNIKKMIDTMVRGLEVKCCVRSKTFQ